MSIISILGARLVTGIGALAIAGSVAAGSGAAQANGAKGDDHHAVRELRHELRDQSKPEREAIVALRKLRLTGPEIAELLAMATSTVFFSALQELTWPWSVMPPTANTTTAARMPRMTITIRSSMRVKPSSFFFMVVVSFRPESVRATISLGCGFDTAP